MTDAQVQLGFIVDALRLAALPPDEQVAALPEFVHVPDEVALNFDDAFAFVPQLVASGDLTPGQVEPLNELDRLFSNMSDEPDKTVWTVDAMRDDHRWARARTLAHLALAALGALPGHPRFDGVTWVRGE